MANLDVSLNLINNENQSKNICDLAAGVRIVFHDGVSAAGNGTQFDVSGFKVVKFGVKNNTTGALVEFRGIDYAGNDDLVPAMQPKTLVTGLIIATSTTDNNETWEADIGGYETFYIKTAAANIIVKGKAVA